MAIRYTCHCGANIRMPVSAAGKRARCQSCGAIFTVPDRDHDPDTQPIPLESGQKSIHDSEDTEEHPGTWLKEFAKSERQTGGQEPVMILDFEDDVPESPSPQPEPVPPSEREREVSPNEGVRQWITDPNRPFWQDLGLSFFFFLEPGNLVTFIVIAFIHLLTVPLAFAGVLGMIGQLFILGYLCTFFMTTILETAAGDDELPNVWISTVWEDLLMPLGRFVGTWLWVCIPALAVIAFCLLNHDEIPWPMVQAFIAIGLFFWPVVLLGVSIGQGFHGLWPHTIVRTFLAAPVAYLCIWFVLLITAALLVLPHLTAYREAIDKVMPGSIWKVLVINAMINIYAMIVAMRAIGLLYRHYKKKFPWVAE